jgi:hypothetical protein
MSGNIEVDDIQQLKTKQPICLLVFPAGIAGSRHLEIFLPGQRKNSNSSNGNVGFAYGIQASINKQNKFCCCIKARSNNARYRKMRWDLGYNKDGVRILWLAGTRASADQMEFASQKVWLNFQQKGYHVVANNCQTFALEVLRCLNTWYPNAVPEEALQIALEETNRVTGKVAERKARRVQFSDTTRSMTGPPQDAPGGYKRPVFTRPAPKTAPLPAAVRKHPPTRKGLQNHRSDPTDDRAQRRARRDYDVIASETTPGRYGDKSQVRVQVPGAWVD